jgi:UDP-N-acetylmuramate--alanine ligase
MELGLSFERVAAGLKDFRGADRRFDVRGEPNGILVVDDYGHHPTEIAAVLAAARTFNRRIVVAFQPHRFTRTKALMDAFGPALAAADHIVLTDIYAAGEDPIPGVTIDVLAAAVRRSVRATVDVEARLDDVVAAIVRVARPGDVVITLGAGSIGTLPEQLIAALGGRAGSAPASNQPGTEPSGGAGTGAPVRAGSEPVAPESRGVKTEPPPRGDKS